MAIQIMQTVIESTAVGGNAKLVWLMIANFTNLKTGRAWPSLTTLSEKTGLSRSQVIRLINKLERLGLLVIKRGGGRTQSNQYQVVAPKNSHTMTPITNGNGITMTPMPKGLNGVISKDKQSHHDTRSLISKIKEKPENIFSGKKFNKSRKITVVL